MTHLMNYVWPNIFETSPHVIQAVVDSIDGLRVALGPAILLMHCLQVCVMFIAVICLVMLFLIGGYG